MNTNNTTNNTTNQVEIKLLKHQYELLSDTEHRMIAIVAGFG